MSPETLLLLLIAVSVLVFIGEPLVRQKLPSALLHSPDQRVEQLSLQKEMLYVAIRDLDFDFHTGKVDQKDYANLRQHLESEAVQILRQLDEVDPLTGLDGEIERQILALRQSSPVKRSPTSALLCSSCAATLQGSENFCPACGQPLLPA